MKEKNPIEDIVKKIIGRLGGEEKPKAEEIGARWEKAVGSAAVAHTKPVALKKATLIVNVDQSSWLYELTLRKKEILSRMDGKKIRDIRFRIGEIK